MTPTLSVIIPTLNEEQALPATLASLAAQQSHPWQVECVVVDGGSSDQTQQLARAAGATLTTAPAGRGQQLRAGAALAKGSVLMFLHADVCLPPTALAAVSQALDVSAAGAGCFAVEHQCSPTAGCLTRSFLRLANQRSRTRALPYGDQAVFCSRALYDQVGGMPALALMEDIAFARALSQHTSLQRLPLAVRASARRFERRPVRTTLCWWTFPLLARWGVKPKTLAKLYGSSLA
jgi:rSAM/selenodomain-associated transferase 2